MSLSFKKTCDHNLMLADKARMSFYQKAIHETVKKGDIVCDIGTGSGIMAFFALQAGAKKVYAIEQNEIIEEAKKLAELNGFERRIDFIKGRSDEVRLPEKVDVITSELIGSFGLEEGLPRFTIDARDRFLKPGGRLLPYWLELYLAPVQLNGFWDNKIGFWNRDFYGLDFSPVKKTAEQQRYLVDAPDKIIFMAAPKMISRFDFYEIKAIASSHTGDFTIGKDGDLHGLIGYFKAGLSENIILSTSPEAPPTHWRQSFFPLEGPFPIKKGDRICCKIKASLNNHIFWQWETDIFRGKSRMAGFSQTDFKIDKEELLIGRNDFRPTLTRDAEISRRILDLCDGSKTTKEIAEIILKEYPENLLNPENAIRSVTKTIRRKVEI